MKKMTLIIAVILVLSLAAAGLAFANGGIELTRWVLGNGGSESGDGDVSLHATLGQPIVGIVSSGEITIGQGFWHSGEPPIHVVFLPFVVK